MWTLLANSIAPSPRCTAAFGIVGDPTVLTLRAQMAEFDRVIGRSADAHNAAFLTAISRPQPLEHRMQAECTHASGSPVMPRLVSILGCMPYCPWK